MIVWLEGKGCDLGVHNGILRAKDVEEVVAAGQLRRLAQDKREQLLEETRAEAQALVAKAEAQARDAMDSVQWHTGSISDAACDQAMQVLDMARKIYETEHARGYDEGQRSAAAEWHEHLAAQRAARAAALQGVHEKLAQIVTAAVQRIVQAEPGEALFHRALRHVKSLSRGVTALTLRVSDGDHASARAALDGLPPGPSQDLNVDLVVDSSLQPGSCVFESEHGVLDASLEIQLDGLRNAMGRAVRQALTSEPDAAALADDSDSDGDGDGDDDDDSDDDGGDHPQYDEEDDHG